MSCHREEVSTKYGGSSVMFLAAVREEQRNRRRKTGEGRQETETREEWKKTRYNDHDDHDDDNDMTISPVLGGSKSVCQRLPPRPGGIHENDSIDNFRVKRVWLRYTPDALRVLPSKTTISYVRRWKREMVSKQNAIDRDCLTTVDAVREY